MSTFRECDQIEYRQLLPGGAEKFLPAKKIARVYSDERSVVFDSFQSDQYVAEVVRHPQISVNAAVSSQQEPSP